MDVQNEVAGSSLATVAILGSLCWEQMGGQTDSQKEGPMVTQYEQNFSDE